MTGVIEKNANPSNLTDLIQQAEQSVADASRQAPHVRAPREQSNFKGHVLALAVVVGFAVCTYFFWHGNAPPSRERVAKDLERVLDMAKASVDAAKSGSGTLPASIPNASLAAVVVYEPGQQDYKLSATVMGVRVILERDGSKTRDTSESK